MDAAWNGDGVCRYADSTAYDACLLYTSRGEQKFVNFENFCRYAKTSEKVERRFGKKFAGFDDAITGRLRYSESRDLKTENIKKEGKSLPFLCFS